MSQSIGVLMGKLAAAVVGETAERVIPVKKPVAKYSKPGKKPMPQPAYSKQADSTLASLLLLDPMGMAPPAPKPKPPQPKKVETAKKIPAAGPIRGTTPVRRKKRTVADNRRGG